MSKNRMMVFFIIGGLILAFVLGFFFYRSNLGPTREAAEKLILNFSEAIASGDLQKARSLMTEESASMLRDPGTLLGEKVYQSLRLKTVDNLYAEGNSIYSADLVLTTLDTLKVITKASQLFAEQIAADGPADDPDLLISDIYSELLARDDLPMIDNFCVIRLESRNGQLRIIGDKALQRILEGSPETYSGMFSDLPEPSP